MRVALLTALTMTAFAANSVLNRAGVGGGQIDAVTFATVRLVAGAAILVALVAWRARTRREAPEPGRRSGASAPWSGGAGRLTGALGLLGYLYGFSLAYGTLDAGVGALVLFGAVQLTMFAGALLGGETVPHRRSLGAAVAFAGLVVLLAPGGGAGVDPVGATAMALAGLGFGLFSLAGRGQADAGAGRGQADTLVGSGKGGAVAEPGRADAGAGPGRADALGATAWTFALGVPPGLALWALLPGGGLATAPGLGLAIVSGAVTSGLGYALWYTVLPALGATRAAVAQLTVPVLVALAGVALLGEPLGWRFAAAAALVLGGVAIASIARRA